MDIVVPIRPNRPDPDHLQYVVRSWAELFPVDRLFIVGRRLPEWADPDEVTHLKTHQNWEKFWNIGQNLEATLTSDVSEEFVWLNDDMFLLKRKRTIPLTNKGPWDHVIYHLGEPRGTGDFQDYILGFRGQRDILRAWGFDTEVEPCTDLHTPMPIVKARMAEILERLKAEYPAHWTGHFRGLYGAGLPSTRMGDVKLKAVDQLPAASWWTVSTAMKSWNGQAGVMLRERFSTPSRFEL